MNEKLLVKNTTCEERERIVMDAIGCESGCEDGVSDHDIAMYRPYIEGKMELREAIAQFRTNYVKGVMEMDRGECGFTR